MTVEAFYHAGLSWWKDAGERTLGRVAEDGGSAYFVDLIGDRASAELATSGGEGEPQLQGEWASFIKRALATRDARGSRHRS